ncbi:MAG: hypothetical protein FWC09_01245, partial [Lachnospiraceae bacterium]|nr:hypothetical protein [Lachnospiraceae bacterium]
MKKFAKRIISFLLCAILLMTTFDLNHVFAVEGEFVDNVNEIDDSELDDEGDIDDEAQDSDDEEAELENDDTEESLDEDDEDIQELEEEPLFENGTEAFPFIIRDIDSLLAYATGINSNSTYEGVRLVTAVFRLASDIDLAGINWNPIGTNAAPFFGVFDGNNYTISNLNINLSTRDYVGLFGSNRGTIKNL